MIARQKVITQFKPKLKTESCKIKSEVQQGNWELDLISNKLHWSDSQYRLYGFEPGEFSLDNEFFINKTTHSSDIARITKIINDAIEAHTFYSFKRRIVKKNGTLAFAETKAEIFRTSDGKPIKIVGTTIEIGGQNFSNIKDYCDPSFFKNFFSDYRKAIYSEIYGQVREKEIAQDLCQEVFIKAWNKMSQYNNEKGKLYTWLIYIARNHCKDYFRSKQHQTSKISSPLDSLHQSYLRRESFNLDHYDLKNLLSQLSIAQKEVIVLLFLEGFTHKEVSSMKNIPLGTVKTRSRDAIIKLRKLTKER